MLITKEITIDLVNRTIPEHVHVVQCDSNTRAVAVTLMAGGVPWNPPEGAIASVAFERAGGSKGWYDQLPDGSNACTVAGNVVTAILAPEMLTVPGRVKASIVFLDADLNQISTFGFTVEVDPSATAGNAVSNSYYKYSTMEDVNAAMEAHDETIAEIERAKAAGEFKGEKGDKGDKGDKGETGAQGPQGEKGDPGKVNVDDTTVGDAAWSGKNIVDKLCPAFEETGAVVKCEPVEGYPLSVVSKIEPSANGHTGVKLAHTGKNLLNIDAGLNTNLSKNGEEYTLKNVSGGSAGSIPTYIPAGVAFTISVELLETTVTTNKPIRVVMTYEDGTGANFNILSSATTFTRTEPKNVRSILFYVDNVKGNSTTFKHLQFEIGKTATAYEPYRGEVLTLDFGETVYGGSLDWNSGVLTVTNGSDGAELAEPYTLQLTPQEFVAVNGTNYLCCNTGNTTVLGRADLATIVKKLSNTIAAMLEG